MRVSVMRGVLLWELTAGARFNPANQDTHWVSLLFTSLWSEMDDNATDRGKSIERGLNDRVEKIWKIEKGDGTEVRIKKGVNGPGKIDVIANGSHYLHWSNTDAMQINTPDSRT